jgi:uridylate kinase
VYTADPKRDPTAQRFTTITFTEALNRGLKVMDATAISLCRENRLPIVVFNLLEPGNTKRVILGEEIGTFVGGE